MRRDFLSQLLIIRNFEKSITRIGMPYRIPRYHFYIGNLISRPYGCHLRVSSICLLGIYFVYTMHCEFRVTRPMYQSKS